jgi:hypothetical protein
MGRETALKARVNSVLRRFTPFDRTVYKRLITRTGGNDLLGRPGTTTHTDTVFDPQPVYAHMGRASISGGKDKIESILSASGLHMTADDFSFLFSPDAYSVDELQNKDIVIVLKTATGAEEVFNILDSEPTSMNGVVIALTVYARPVKR